MRALYGYCMRAHGNKRILLILTKVHEYSNTRKPRYKDGLFHGNETPHKEIFNRQKILFLSVLLCKTVVPRRQGDKFQDNINET